VAKSVYERLKELESYIPMLDANSTDNANDLLRIVGMIANKHNELIRRLQAQGITSFDDLIIDISEAMDRPIFDRQHKRGD
jgi:hypothetical protein